MAIISNNCYNTQYGSFQKWEIGNIIRALLIADEDIFGMIGDNVYPLVAPENTLGDFVVYNRTKYRKDEVKGGVYQDVCTIELKVISDNYDDSIALASYIDNALTGKHKLENGSVIKIMLTDSAETFAELKYIQVLEFEIR